MSNKKTRQFPVKIAFKFLLAIIIFALAPLTQATHIRSLIQSKLHLYYQAQQSILCIYRATVFTLVFSASDFDLLLQLVCYMTLT